MGTTVLLAAFVATTGMGATIPEAHKELQNEIFQTYWGTDFVWKFADLPAKGTVPNFRVPYSGYIYPDTAGGTINAMRKYDAAFNGGRSLAAAFERWDTTAFQEPRRAGLFGWRVVMRTPGWHGHCNGWATAAMRHAEPQTGVRRNGVYFSQADIKALLAEIYIYNETLNLDGPEYPINAGTFHAILTNWIGRGAHPIGMEADPGKEKWNYPIYAYSTSSAPQRDGSVDVRMNMAYAKDSRGEYQSSPRIRHVKYFHYNLDLNENGEIVGGQFYRGSSIIDLLWLPLRPKQGKQPGNERGNPHVDVDEVLAIWRASVPEDERKKWPVIDPPAEDRVSEFPGLTTLVPVQHVGHREEDAVAAIDESETSEPATGEADAGEPEPGDAPN
jgi:hypothetical protein